MSKSFKQLGIPFPLFKAPSHQAAEYVGLNTCSLCQRSGQHCFKLLIGTALMLNCPACGTSNGLDADDRANTPCTKCQVEIEFPIKAAGDIHSCYDCLRAGKAALTKDSVHGMISWEQAATGDGTLSSENMLELLRTPNFVSIQGEVWQFCCDQPMAFLGEWTRDDFSDHAPDGDGEALFEQIVQDPVPDLWEDELHDETGVYVFRCRKCKEMTAYWDIA